MFKFLIFLSLISVSYGKVCSGLEKLQNGFSVSLGQFPFHVLIFTKRHCISDFCGGTIIHENWILTSGYCLYGHERIRAYGGVIDVRNLAEAEYMSGDIHSDHFVIHPAYKHRSGRNNIGLFYVCEKIKSSTLVSPANLPSKFEKLDDGLTANLAGFGSLKKNRTSSGVMKQITKIVDISGLCDESFDEGKFKPEQHLCLKTGVEGVACVSDHGSGLFVTLNSRQAIHGILNFYAEEGCDKGFPEVYVRVKTYLSWIYTVTGIEDSEIDPDLKSELEENNLDLLAGENQEIKPQESKTESTLTKINTIESSTSSNIEASTKTSTSSNIEESTKTAENIETTTTKEETTVESSTQKIEITTKISADDKNKKGGLKKIRVKKNKG